MMPTNIDLTKTTIMTKYKRLLCLTQVVTMIMIMIVMMMINYDYIMML